MASLRPSQSPCSDKIRSSSTWLICAHQLLRLSCNLWSRLQLGHVKLNPSTSRSPLQRSSQPCLCSITNDLGQGRGGLLRFASQQGHDEDGKVLKLPVLIRPFAAILGAAFQQPLLPDEVKSSLVTHVLKKRDRCDPATSDRLQWVSLSADCVLPSSIAALPAGLKKLACGLLARQAGPACPQSISCLLFTTSSIAPDHTNILGMWPLWTSERPLKACSTLSSGHSYRAREFMPRRGHTDIEVQ